MYLEHQWRRQKSFITPTSGVSAGIRRGVSCLVFLNNTVQLFGI
jgi:hypothetical protein